MTVRLTSLTWSGWLKSKGTRGLVPTVSLPAVRPVVKRSLLTDCQAREQQLTPPEVRGVLRKIVGSSKIWGHSGKAPVTERVLPSGQAELQPRRMIDSYREVLIPLGRDPSVRETYVNFYNSVRFGRIMEDLDTLAVWIGYTHNQDPSSSQDHQSPLSIVTAQVDSINIQADAMKQDADIVLRGHTTWVGNTSMEISMNVEQDCGGSWNKILQAQFLMVARDPQRQRKAYVHPLQVDSADEKALFEQGAENRTQRQREAQESLLRMPPSESERLIVHNLFLQTIDERAATFRERVKPTDSVWMDKTLLKNIQICFPEQRNLYNTIFGGFLMRQAFELAWANACVYSKTRPSLLSVDDIIFQKPVKIGSLLYFSAQVVYTEGPYLQLRVHAEVVDPQTGQHQTTNIFHYTFHVQSGTVPTVVPQTYAEYMMFLDGKRHFEASRRTPLA